MHLLADAIVILDVFEKKTAKTKQAVIDTCRRRLKAYGSDVESETAGGCLIPTRGSSYKQRLA